MSSKIVQVKPNVLDPDFPDTNLGGCELKYIETYQGQIVFEFVKPSIIHIQRCKKSGLNPHYISLDRSEVFWNKKDWISIPAGLSCYNTIKRRRRHI